jgi:glycosyltransferase involved in cell wall biosynthesis
MRVLYVTQYFSSKPMHASTVTTYEIVKRLSERGHDVGVISAHSPMLIRVYTKNRRQPADIMLPLGARFDAKWYNGFTTLFTHTLAHIPLIATALFVNQFYEKFDVIISMYHPSHMATVSAFFLSRVLKLPLVAKIHDFIVEAWEPFTIKRIYNVVLGDLNLRVLKRCDAILVQSRELMSFAKREGVDEEKMLFFPNGVDTEVFRPGIGSDELRKRLGLDGKTVILFLGGLYRGRHPELLVKALPEILRESKDLMVLFVGEGTEKPKLISLVQRLGVSDFVRFVGSVEHSVTHKFVSLADVAVGPLTVTSFPSIYGSTPLTVLEYMACEKPVIVCRGAVSKSLVIDGYNGMLLDPGDVNGLSAAIINLIKDRRLAKSIGRNARRHIEDVYSWNVLIMKLEKVLKSLVWAN